MRSYRYGGKAPGYLTVIFDDHRLELTPIALQVLPIPVELRSGLYALGSELQHPGVNAEDVVDSLLVRLLIGLNRLVWQDNSLHADQLSPLNTTVKYRIFLHFRQ
jgi:hypothetical protein